MTAVAGALGSVIGYVGGEVAEPVLFERLLWPQRFYHEFNSAVFIRLALLMPMGGPVHKVGIDTLEKFRKSGLYRGASRGNMLGTAFYKDGGGLCFERPIDESSREPESTRNGFWQDVLALVHPEDQIFRHSKMDAEDTRAGKKIHEKKYRSIQIVHQLTLEPADLNKDSMPSKDTIVDETSISWQTVAGIFSTELITVGLAIFMGAYEHVYWLAGFLLVPLFLKLICLGFNVRREPLAPWSGKGVRKVFELDKPSWGFGLIDGLESPDGEESIARQFFLHYGHPCRNDHSFFGDRFNELGSMVLVAVFVFYFPAGLLSLVWMDPHIQYIWLGYQVYTIVVMHFVRLFGGSSVGSSQNRCAAILQAGNTVWLKGTNGSFIKAHLVTTEVESVKLGNRYIKEVLQRRTLTASSSPTNEPKVSNDGLTPKTDPEPAINEQERNSDK